MDSNRSKAAQALVLSRCGDGVRYVFDTFMDVDRGYYPRRAFIDRRFNPRPAAGVFTLLAGYRKQLNKLEKTLAGSGSGELG